PCAAGRFPNACSSTACARRPHTQACAALRTEVALAIGIRDIRTIKRRVKPHQVLTAQSVFRRSRSGDSHLESRGSGKSFGCGADKTGVTCVRHTWAPGALTSVLSYEAALRTPTNSRRR